MPGSGLYGPPPWYFYDLARAYAMKEGASGWGRAVPLFEKAVGPAVDRVGWGDVYALSHYELAMRFEAAAHSSSARAAQRREALEKARAHFGAFLDLWGDAEDLYSARVKDARRRLSALESE